MTTPATWTVRTLLGWSAPWLERRGVASPRLDSELLLAKALDLRRIDLFMDPHRPLTAPELAAFKALLTRRAAREPVAHLLGVREFWGLEFYSSRAALIPRPETELLLETVLASFADRQAPLEMFEPCVGSGAVLCALLHEYPGATGVGSDLSAEALELARRNATKSGCGDRVTLLEGDLDTPLPADARFDVVVINPPYIVSGDLPGLQPEVRDWEPRLALDGGGDGLQVLRRLPGLLQARVRPGGVAVIEIGDDQGETVMGLFQSAGFEQVELLLDYHRSPRAVVIRTRQSS
ncbi:MAG: peptide chain release factor N(5)-glutamine methyltransferase [Magnetococcales bacterium]|nr:peptide chain release factor N(5)-glutamine methyltransferase [Magnetococcales bacterium]